ncbi:glycosyltransferase family 9 protein [Geomonas sp.]|uniref:glycosyltransferase family 9 protein n=1 Tax=Geomonas sp. TaxID=2651584 RepID=UPI002B472EDA|nr:glycosyltransferase family 9 protein [Geomonas sp.]HJV35782.1 glycosyltransferase family 9 protein [Geomonas sp.]
MNIKLMKRIDSVLGSVAACLLPGAPGVKPIRPKRVLLVRPGGIGDAVLLVPAIRALQNAYPEAEITVLAERRNAAVFSLCPGLDRVLLYDQGDLFQVLGGGYDLVIDTEQWHRLSAVVCRLARPQLSIGFATNARKRLFSHRIPYAHDRYEAESFFDLLAPLGIERPASLETPFLVVPAEAAARAKALLGDIERPRVAFFPGASIAERRWGAERFRQVADHLALRGLLPVVVGGGEDAEEGEYIVKRCGGINLAGKTSLVETAAVLARSLLLVSGDSGVLHLAVGLGVPTVSLFGPGIEAKWGPKGEFDLVLNKKLACSPCTRFGTTPTCREKARCLSDIMPAEVVEAVMTVLDKRFPE